MAYILTVSLRNTLPYEHQSHSGFCTTIAAVLAKSFGTVVKALALWFKNEIWVICLSSSLELCGVYNAIVVGCV